MYSSTKRISSSENSSGEEHVGLVSGLDVGVVATGVLGNKISGPDQSRRHRRGQ